MDDYEIEEAIKRFMETDRRRAADGITLLQIIRQLHSEAPDTQAAAVVSGAKDRFNHQFPGLPFPWIDRFVVDVWNEYKAETDSGPEPPASE